MTSRINKLRSPRREPGLTSGKMAQIVLAGILALAAPALANGQAALPGPPQNLTASVNGSTVTLGWQAPATGAPASTYLLEASYSSSGPVIALLGVLDTSYAVPAVPDNTYYVRVRSVNSDGQSAPSNEIVVTVAAGGGGACASPPNRPQNLTGNVSGTLISINWAPPVGGCPPASYTVYAGSGSGLSNITTVGVGLQTGVSANAAPATYYINVIAVNAYGSSAAANELSLTVGSSAPPPPPSASVTHWTVTQAFVSVTGPDNCWVRMQRATWTGAIFPGIPMAITLAGSSLTLESPEFAVNYAGTFSGLDFAASGGPLVGGGWPCADGTLFQQQPGVSNLSGRVTPDGRFLTATEVNSYRLTTGELVTYVWEWQARRQR